MTTGDERYFDLLKRSINQYLYLGGNESLDGYFVDAEPRYAGHAWTVPATCQPLTVSHRRQLDFLHDRAVAG